jgi:dTMP kinase
MRKRAIFVTFEGIEGSGKSTQIRSVHDRLAAAGKSVFVTREPGGSPLSDAIRGVLLQSGKFEIDPLTELLLIEAARRQHVTDVLSSALAKHDVVLCDRFTDSSVAYQGGGRRIDRALVDQLNGAATAGLTPDLTVLLDMPPAEALPRAIERLGRAAAEGREDRFEKENRAFHERVREAYLALAREEPARFFVVDARDTREAITEAIVRRIEATPRGRR